MRNIPRLEAKGIVRQIRNSLCIWPYLTLSFLLLVHSPTSGVYAQEQSQTATNNAAPSDSSSAFELQRQLADLDRKIEITSNAFQLWSSVSALLKLKLQRNEALEYSPELTAKYNSLTENLKSAQAIGGADTAALTENEPSSGTATGVATDRAILKQGETEISIETQDVIPSALQEEIYNLRLSLPSYETPVHLIFSELGDFSSLDSLMLGSTEMGPDEAAKLDSLKKSLDKQAEHFYTDINSGIELLQSPDDLRESDYLRIVGAYLDSLSPVRFEGFKDAMDNELDRAVEEADRFKSEFEIKLTDIENKRSQVLAQISDTLRGQTIDLSAIEILKWLSILLISAMGLLPLSEMWFGKALLDKDSNNRVFSATFLLQFSTVFLLTIAILLLGLGEKLEKQVLGTLIGGIAGYVLGRSVGGSGVSA